MRIFTNILIIQVLFIGLVYGQNRVQSSAAEVKAILDLRAYTDFVSAEEGQEQIIYVLNNDNGVSEGIDDLQIIQMPEYGMAEVVDKTSIKYRAATGFTGADELRYKVCVNGECDEASVRIDIADFDFIPIVNSDTIFLKPEEQLEINILENDTNLFDTPISVSIITDINNGYCHLTEDNLLVTDFDDLYRGVDSVLYSVCDAEGDCEQAWVFFQIKGDVEADIFIPQGISPNGDGFNDEFLIPDLQGVPMQIRIFNAFGELVFVDNQYQNNWNGIANKGRNAGSLSEKGTYYYVLKVPVFSKEFSGFIYLNR